MMRWLLVFLMGAVACQAGGERVGFNNGPGDAGLDAAATGDVMFPNLGRDALMVRDTGPVIIAEDAACATASADAQRRPMNLLLVLDRSGSMADRASTGGPTRWAAAVSAIRSLVMRLDDETRVGITFFPAPSMPDSASSYAAPAVPVAPLRETRATILARLSATSPNGNTPMTCAIQGSIAYYRGFTMDGSHNLVLITDGIPTEECTDTNDRCGAIPNLLDLAAFARWAACRDAAGQNAVRVQVALGQRETPPVRTFVCGTPEASDTFLSDLAVTGASQRTPTCRASQSCHYSLRGASFESDLTMAFNEIQGRALSCEFELDVDPSRIDPTRVNVNYQGTGDSSSRLVPRDVSHADGWDWSAGMRSVVLYGAACDRVRTDPMARVRILFGCPTVTPG